MHTSARPVMKAPALDGRPSNTSQPAIIGPRPLSGESELLANLTRAAPACVSRPFTITLKTPTDQPLLRTRPVTTGIITLTVRQESTPRPAEQQVTFSFFQSPQPSLSLSSLFLFFSIADHTPTLLTQAASKSCSSMWGVFLPAVRASSHPCTESLRSTLHPDRAFPTPTPRGENGKKVVALQGMDTLRDVQIP